MIAATASRSSSGSGTAPTAAMPPRPDSRRNALLRKATTRAASSNDSAPATQAAAISPWLCPTTAAGSTPYERHSAASDTITAHDSGWIASTPAPVSSVPRST